MYECTYTTSCGDIHYWVNTTAEQECLQLVFLPGLTADHRLFDKQIEFFEGRFPVFVWKRIKKGYRSVLTQVLAGWSTVYHPSKLQTVKCY